MTRTTWIAVAVAAVAVGMPAGAQERVDAPPAARPALPVSLSDLIARTAEALQVTIVYEHDIGRRVVAIAESRGRATGPQLLLDEVLALSGLRLELTPPGKVGRIVPGRAAELMETPLVVPAGSPIPDGAADRLVTRALALRHAWPRAVEPVLRRFVDARIGESIDALPDSSDALVVTARGRRHAALEAIVATFDRPRIEREVATVVDLKHGDPSALARLVALLAPQGKNESPRDWVRAQPAPFGRSLVLVGPPEHVERARAIVTQLDREPEGEKK